MSILGKSIRGTMMALVATTLTLGGAGAVAEPMGELRLLTWTKTQFPIQSDTLVVNVRNAPYDDPALRLALSLATPRERMLNEFSEGYGNIAGSVIAPANAFWHDDSVEPYVYDIEKARQVLADAGYTWDSEGRLQLPE